MLLTLCYATLQTGWSFLPQERGEFVDMLPARQQIDDSTWYRGTADAVYQIWRLSVITIVQNTF